MAGGEGQRRAHEGRSDQARYAGPLSCTRTEPVQVWMPDASIRVMRVFVGVDAVSDPALATLARGGTLHHVDDGVALAIPFVYHDPDLALFVLVVPEALRHRALALRAELMADLARLAEVELPDYVRDVEVVIGHHELSERIAAGAPLRRGPDDAQALALREATLAERERELERRERLVMAREGAFDEAEPSTGVGRVLDSELEEVYDGDAIDPEATVIELGLREYRHDGSLDAMDPDDAEADELQDAEDVDDAEDVGDVEDLDPNEAVDTDEDDGDVIEAMPVEAALDYERSSLMPSTSDKHGEIPLPPDEFLSDPRSSLSIAAHDDRVWVFVRDRPPSPYDASDVDLLIQVDPDASIPVVVITLVFHIEGTPDVRRGVIDPQVRAEVSALEQLAERFEAQLVALEPNGDLVHWATLRGPRASNAACVLAHVREASGYERSEFSLARRLVLSAPPPVPDGTHPFELVDDEPARTATEAAVAVDELAPWLTPQRRSRALLLLSVPESVIEQRVRRVVEDALDFGLSIPEPLRAAARELSIASDDAEVLRRRLRGLCRTSKEGEQSGLEEAVLRTLWSEALAEAAKLGVTISDEEREHASRHAGPDALGHLDAAHEAHDDALGEARAALSAERPELSKLQVLAERGVYGDLIAVARAASRFPPEDLARLFARMAKRNDVVSIDALEAIMAHGDDLRLRISAALALAARRSPTSIAGLVSHVQREGEPEFRAFALALGRYGGGSLRGIARELASSGVDDERVALVYAHLSLHGARAQLKARARGAQQHEAAVATRALALASELKDTRSTLTGLEEQGWLTVFCDLFDQALRDVE